MSQAQDEIMDEIDLMIMHESRECDGMCPYCIEEAEERKEFYRLPPLVKGES